MNIFVLASDPSMCARYHCDKHVVKMIVESAQLLCTAHYVNGTRQKWMYKPTHVNHPCAVWVRASHSNYVWLLSLAEHLCSEYTLRYGRVHKTSRIIARLRKITRNTGKKPKRFVYCGLSKAKASTVIGSYRKLYTLKSKTMKVTWKTKQPTWYVPGKYRPKKKTITLTMTKR